MNILVVDVGGTHIKALATGRRKPLKIRSGSKMTAKQMVQAVRHSTMDWHYAACRLAIPDPCCTASR